MTKPTIILDSSIVIDYLRKRQPAVEFLDALSESPLVSVVVIAELYQGVRDGQEMKDLEQTVEAFNVIPLDEELARRGGLIARTYRKSHGVSLGDAMIAATEEKYQAQLVTLNTKHFPMLPDVVKPY